MKKIDKLLTFLVSLSGLVNAGAGVAAFILYIQDAKVAESILGAYLAFFGVLQVLSQMRVDGKKSVKLVRNNFGFMTSHFGQGVYLVFVGSLGISFNWGSETQHWLPFIAGCLTAAMAILSFLRSCCGGDAGYSEIEG
eukprot:TRINITY_DN491_c1_g1_i4.p1 TRINITY_DN491_c1_g1~~TRINITY_DN491_c1_g1_i4.p1  ORF type:complete len:138 (+),score=15.06 TRINITY_DN491_c1_g1_i4:553-966(+)